MSRLPSIILPRTVDLLGLVSVFYLTAQLKDTVLVEIVRLYVYDRRLHNRSASCLLSKSLTPVRIFSFVRSTTIGAGSCYGLMLKYRT